MIPNLPLHLYKYRGGSDDTFNRDLRSLVESYYWSAAIPTLNDPCEALINTDNYFNDLNGFEKVVHSLVDKKIDVSAIRSATKQLLDKVLTTGVFSLSKTHDDELMWSHYGAAHHGFCVGYNMHYLKRNLKSYFYNVMEVGYEASPPEMNLMQQMLSKDKDAAILQLIGTKSTKWANEQEIRIVSDEPGKHQHDFRAIDEIYFGLRMSQAYKERLMFELKGRKIKYFQMEMAKGAYNFVANPITDNYKNAPSYLYKVSPVMDGAVDEKSVQPRFKHLTAYLQKAIEVARREPYCIEVVMADFSYTCPDDAPFIFVHCNRTDQEYSNFEYTLTEIDSVYNLITDLNDN